MTAFWKNLVLLTFLTKWWRPIRGHPIVDGDVYAHRCVELPESTIHAQIDR